MLHAPLTLTTAKLDISLLLKSSSPSPPPNSSAPISTLPPATRPLSGTGSVLYPPPSSSQRTSPSSTVSETAAPGPPQLYPQAGNYPPVSTYPPSQRAYLPPLVTPTPYNVSHSSPRVPAQPPPHHHPIKRPPPTPAHPSASPAKKQSKWTPEEDALIIELRGSGMKWEDISKRLPGRSAISCRLHYQNYLERRSEWDEERKNRLARLYERLKPEMWGPLAAELGIPWRAAEAMHWHLGEADMARRAGVVPFSLAATPGGSALPLGGMPSGPMVPGPGGVMGYGVDDGRGPSAYAPERAGSRAGFVGAGESLGRLGRRSGDPGIRSMHSPGGRSVGGGSMVGDVVLPSVAEMERGLTAFAGGQAGPPPTGPGTGQGPGGGPGYAGTFGHGIGRGAYQEEDRRREER